MKRSEFEFPSGATYICGNSLGLLPKASKVQIERDIEKWSTLGVDGHFAEPGPWLHAEVPCSQAFVPIVGAKYDHEIVIMGELSTNIHLVLSAFYRPSGPKYKILIEQGAFPSDLFVVHSFLKNRNAPEDALLLLPPGPYGLFNDDSMIEFISQHISDLALVFLGGVNYYTGQVLNIQALVRHCHKLGIMIGLDLAHAVGNIPLQLHDWNVDFALWCNYKYMNGGPGTIGGVFLHDKYKDLNELPNHPLMGWWGCKPETRMRFSSKMDALQGAKAFQCSNPSPILISALEASARLFPPMELVREHSYKLTQMCRQLIQKHEHLLVKAGVSIITPSEKHRSGAQLSLYFKNSDAEMYFTILHGRKIIGDLRGDKVIRITFCGMYNNESDVETFCDNFIKIITK